MKFLALLSSMPFESDQVLDALRNVRVLNIAGKTVYRGRLSGHDIILLNTGIGKVNAAHSATCIIEYFQVKQVVNFGVGGAYPQSGLKIGDIAVASKEIYGDEGVITSKGWDSLRKIGIPLLQDGTKKYFNEFTLSLNRPFEKGGRGDFQIKRGNFVTVSATTGAQRRAIELGKRFNAICENMEGAAVAHVCTIYKIPFLEVRGISNVTGVRDKRKWDLKLASGNCQKAVLEFMTRYKNGNGRFK